MNILYKLIGKALDKVLSFFRLYKSKSIEEIIDGGGKFEYPFSIAGAENIKFGESVSIGAGSIILTTRAKLFIKGHFISGPGLTIITGDHMPILGRYLDTVSDEEKDIYDVRHEYDQDVVIEEDVWCGANVTILKGVTIGRGSIIAAGAVVSKNIPPYSVAGGVPARVIKTRLNDSEIEKHEAALY